MENISPLGWLCIGSLILIAVVINLALVVMLRNPDPRVLNRIRMPRSDRPVAGDMRKIVQVLRDPFHDEREQLNELSNQVKKIKQSGE